MKQFWFRNAYRVKSLTLSAVLLLSILTVNVFADVNYPVSWRLSSLSYLAYLPQVPLASKSITPGEGLLSDPTGSGYAYIYISFTFDDSINISEGSIVSLSFSLSTAGAASTSIGDSYPRLYPGSLTGSNIYLEYPGLFMDSTNTDNFMMRKVTSGSSGVVCICSFPFNPRYLTYTIPFQIYKDFSGSQMYLTTLISPIVTGPSFEESLFSAITDISLKIQENTVTQQQGNSIVQRVLDDLDEQYVDHDVVEEVKDSINQNEEAEAEVKSAAEDLLTQPVYINGTEYNLTVDHDIFDTYKSAFSTVLEGWDTFSIAGATVFRRSLTDLFAIFGIFVIFPCTLGLLGALLGRY